MERGREELTSLREDVEDLLVGKSSFGRVELIGGVENRLDVVFHESLVSLYMIEADRRKVSPRLGEDRTKKRA